jgi:uncharacterized cupredoxin-like copper-binding protein
MRTPIRSFITGAMGAAFSLLVLSSALYADQVAMPLQMSFGSASGEMVILPGNITLTAGERYQLVIENPSSVTHYIGVAELAGAVETEDLQIENWAAAVRQWKSPHAPRALGKLVEPIENASGTYLISTATVKATLQSPNRKVRGVIHPSVNNLPTTWVPTRSLMALSAPQKYEFRPVKLRAGGKVTWMFVAGSVGNYGFGCAMKSHNMEIKVEIL